MHEGKTYIVTGAASGIGAETCRVLRASGAQVIGVDRNPATDVDQMFQVDMADKSSVAELIAALLEGTFVDITAALARTLMGIGLLTLATIGPVSRPITIPVRVFAAVLAIINALPFSVLPTTGQAITLACSVAILVWSAIPGRATAPVKSTNF